MLSIWYVMAQIQHVLLGYIRMNHYILSNNSCMHDFHIEYKVALESIFYSFFYVLFYNDKSSYSCSTAASCSRTICRIESCATTRWCTAWMSTIQNRQWSNKFYCKRAYPIRYILSLTQDCACSFLTFQVYSLETTLAMVDSSLVLWQLLVIITPIPQCLILVDMWIALHLLQTTMS